MINFHIRKAKLKSGKIKHRAIITDSGKGIKSKTFDRKADAKLWAERLKLEYQSNHAKGVKPCNVTFKQLCDEYMSAWAGKDHDRVRMVKFWCDIFGENLLSDIDEKVIKSSLDGQSKLSNNRCNGWSAATYNKHRGQLSSLFKFAVERNLQSTSKSYVKTNPVEGVQPKPLDNKRVRYLSDKERPRIIAACKEIGGMFYVAFLIALSTGMRKSEVMGLSWSDIDFKDGLAKLSDTKNGQPRYCPIPDKVLDELKKHRGVGNSLVFPCSKDSDKPATFNRQWAKARKDADIKDFRWHDLRHDTASRLAMDGATLLQIGEILGHKSPVSTYRYAHLSTKDKSRTLNSTMSKSLDGI